ncbi:hypothetical protein LguiA_003820 [Lonicera macranthoides]
MIIMHWFSITGSKVGTVTEQEQESRRRRRRVTVVELRLQTETFCKGNSKSPSYY